MFASAEIGRPFAPLNYRLPDVELRKLLGRTAPSVAIVDDDMVPRVEGVDGVIIVSRSEFDAACLDVANRTADQPTVDRDIAVLLFTSGTTGEPKAAVLRHRHLASYVISTVEFMHAEEDEAALVSVPPYHIAGVAAILTAVYSGRRIVLPAGLHPRDSGSTTAAQEEITHAMVVPTMLGRILDVLKQRGEALPRLKSLSYGGGRMPPPVIERALPLLPHVDFANAYGLTETSSTIAVLRPTTIARRSTPSDPAVRRRMGSVGRPLPSVELEIRGPEGECCRPASPARSMSAASRSRANICTARLIHDDGWFATNDAGWLDEEGYLFVEGRARRRHRARRREHLARRDRGRAAQAPPGRRRGRAGRCPTTNGARRSPASWWPEGGRPTTDELAGWVKQRLRSTKTPEVWNSATRCPTMTPASCCAGS